MRSGRINPNIMAVPASRFDKVIEWLLVSLLAFMPFAFGAVEAWSEMVVIALAAAISVVFLLKLIFEKDAVFIWSWSYVPVGIFILVAVFQLIPLPVNLVKAVSPNTAALKSELLGDLPGADNILSKMTFSFYPHAGKHDLGLVLSVVAVFVVVVNVFRRPNRVKRLLAAISIIAGGIAVLALAQDVFGNGKIYWLVHTPGGQSYSGPFVNRSHFGQFMNLSIGAALGLLMVKLHEVFTGKKVTPPVVAEYLSSSQARVIWLLVAMIILGATAVFVSLTRGGIVSMLIAGAFTTLVLSSRKSLKGRGWFMALIALGAFICVLYIGFDAVYDRLATLRELHEYKGRWQIVKDIGIAWTRFPVLGTGLGTHEVVYPMFDRSTTPALATYAENEYAQMTEETGLFGLLILVLFAALVWRAYIRNITTASIPVRSAAYGLGFGLLAIMLHSLSDFGQHLPANAILSVVSCALLLGLAHTGQKANQTVKIAKASLGSRSLRVAALLGTFTLFVWALLSANNARLADANWKQALNAEHALMEMNWQGTNTQFAYLISKTESAAKHQPDNVKYRHWLNVYRWRSISRVTDPNTGKTIIPQQAIQFVPRIIDELHKIRLLCPTYGATYCFVGQLEKIILDDPGGTERIRKGFRLAPCDSTACFMAGLLDAEERQIDASFEKFSRAIQLDSRLFKNVADMYMNHFDRPDMAVALASDDTARLSYVAGFLTDLEEHKDIAEKARVKVRDLLKAKCEKPDASAGALASLANIYRREKDWEAAIEYYRRALASDYSKVYWHYNLAMLLVETGRIPEAIHEARICLRLSPQFEAAKKLIEDLSVHPGALGEESPGS